MSILNETNLAHMQQKFGTLDTKRFNDILNSFSDEEETVLSEKPVLSQQKIIKDCNICIFCKKFECIADSEAGAYVCTSCGRVNGEILDSSQEWRPPSFDDPRRGDQSRVGIPVNEHFIKASLSTSINGWGNQLFRQFHRYNSMDYDERSLLKNFQQIDSSTEDMVPEAVKEHAKNLYKTISTDENKRGAKKNSNMAACVFFASETRNCATNVEEISKQFNIKKKKFTKGCNFYREQLFEKEPAYYAKMRPVTAEDEIKKVCNSLGINEMYANISCYVAHMAQELGIVIKNTPISIAVGAVYLVSVVYKLGFEKKDISEKCDISDVTVNKSFNLLSGYKNYLIPNKVLFDKYMELKKN